MKKINTFYHGLKTHTGVCGCFLRCLFLSAQEIENLCILAVIKTKVCLHELY